MEKFIRWGKMIFIFFVLYLMVFTSVYFLGFWSYSVWFLVFLACFFQRKKLPDAAFFNVEGEKLIPKGNLSLHLYILCLAFTFYIAFSYGYRGYDFLSVDLCSLINGGPYSFKTFEYCFYYSAKICLLNSFVVILMLYPFSERYYLLVYREAKWTDPYFEKSLVGLLFHFLLFFSFLYILVDPVFTYARMNQSSAPDTLRALVYESVVFWVVYVGGLSYLAFGLFWMFSNTFLTKLNDKED